jgi:hypothetical protein
VFNEKAACFCSGEGVKQGFLGTQPCAISMDLLIPFSFAETADFKIKIGTNPYPLAGLLPACFAG